jgi:hypothetical protein
MLRVDYSGVQWAEKDICSQKAVNYLIEQRSVLNAKGDTIGLNGFGAFAGERLARCALLQYEKDTKGTALANDAVRLSFAEWVSYTGSLLALSPLFSALESEIDKRAAERAKLYLEYAKSQGVEINAQVMSMLNKKFFAKPVADDKTGPVALGGTAVTLNERFSGNRFAFVQSYEGKLLEITGKVATISTDGSNIALLGDAKRKKGELNYNSFVWCKSFNGEPLQGVASLTIDQDIKIKGFLDTKTAGIPLGIAGYFVLKDCQIQ